jgi:AAA domain-containing protein
VDLPISFVYGNLVFGPSLDDAWAAFSVPCTSYRWLSEEVKNARLATLMGALEALEADVQILRVGHPWARDSYLREIDSLGDPSHARPNAVYVREHAPHLDKVGPTQPSLFLLVSLRDPDRDVATYVSRAVDRHPREWLRSLGQALWSRDRRLLRAADLERLCVRANELHACLEGFLSVRPTRGVELQWLVRRAFCRGLGEPQVDGLHDPRALAFEHKGQALLAPLEADVVRWMDGCVEHRGRSLRVESELGVSFQAHLVLGALPERADFPGARAELMFAPVESLPFAVDLSLNARFLPNELALRIARRRIQDADQIARAESDGDQGLSDLGRQRAEQARDLLAHLRTSRRPPLLRATLTIAVGAPDEQTLAERVETCRRAYGEVCLHRPLGDQLALFLQHLPAQRTRVAGYDDTLTTEQVAAMMPTATHICGSQGGFYLGHTLSASRQPVRFNLREGSERDRNTAILSVGALGSGKTTLAQKLKYEAFLQGARVIDCDPKGDHRFHLLEEVAPHAETIALRPDPALRGMLDPLRVAPEHLRQEAAVSFLLDLLPNRAEASWETAVVTAVDTVMRRAPIPTCREVVSALCESHHTEAQVGKALAVYASSGLTQLGFADATASPTPVGESQVTYISIRDLPGPDAGTARRDYTQAERVGVQMVRLIAMFAMHLMSQERDRLKIFSLDNAL